MKKTGITWDSVPIDGIKPEDFRHDSFDIFREQAERSQRMDSKALSVDNPQLLDNLKATSHRAGGADAQSDFLSDCIEMTPLGWRPARNFCAR